MSLRPALLLAFGLLIAAAACAAEPAWTTAHRKPALTADETKALMKKWATYVFEHHLKKNLRSEQQGMVYEYFDTRKKGQFDQFVQGEALDTMHDGAWLIAANCTAYRATGDRYYKDFVTSWQLPFYLKMLLYSDEFFTAKRNDARAGAPAWDREHGLIEGERGFVPYYWDDGGSVSLERRLDKNPQPIAPSVDNLAGKPNPNYLLDGYSLGSSNHLAQDLGVMLLVAYETLHTGEDDADQELSAEIRLAVKDLHESRMRHHGFIPMCAAPLARIKEDATLLAALPDPNAESFWRPDNHYTAATIQFQPGKKYPTPGFMDNQEYYYYAALAKTKGVLPRPLAFKLVFDALTEPMLFDRYFDDAPRPPGINRFDLYPFHYIDGKPEHFRSQKKGPGGRPVPLGSRMGPQTMVVCGWALKALRQYPDLWEEGIRRDKEGRMAGLPKTSKEVAAILERELVGGLRTWEAIFAEYGYIPTSIGRSPDWDAFSDSGGYAHLIKAGALWVELCEGK